MKRATPCAPSNSCLWVALGLAIASLACGGSDKKGEVDVAASGTLGLVREAKFSSLLSGADRFEASGVVLHGGALYVAFDNMTKLGIVDVGLTTGRTTSGDVVDSQYEAITWNANESKLLVAQESNSDGFGTIVEFSASGDAAGTVVTDVSFVDHNKGFEGLAWVESVGTEYLLALCEGNYCTGDDTSLGHGRVVVLRREGSQWVTETKLDVPVTAAFEDYADLALLPNDDGSYTAAIVSQESAALWIGTLKTSPWELVGAGVVYAFPKSDGGQRQYCEIEGITFLDRTTLAMVSDKTKDSACAAKSESVHVFALP